MIKASNEQLKADASIVIVSYDLLSRMQGKLEEQKFKVCVADEAHYLKSKDSKRS